MILDLLSALVEEVLDTIPEPTLRYLFGSLDLLTFRSATRQKLWTGMRCEIDLERTSVKPFP